MRGTGGGKNQFLLWWAGPCSVPHQQPIYKGKWYTLRYSPYSSSCVHTHTHTYTHTHTHKMLTLGNSTVFAFHMFHTFSSSHTGIQVVISCLRQGRRQPVFERVRREKSCFPRLRRDHSLWLLWAGRLWVSLCNCGQWRRKLCVYHHSLDPGCRSVHFARDSQFTDGLEAAEVKPEWPMETGTVEISVLISLRNDKYSRSLPNTSTPHKTLYSVRSTLL